MEARSLTKGTPVLFEWQDSVSSGGWFRDAEKVKEVAWIYTRGYVVGWDEDSLIVTHSISDSGQFLDPLTVPWGAIVELEELGAS